MSTIIKDIQGKNTDCNMIPGSHVGRSDIDWVMRIGDTFIPMREFCVLSRHYMTGGIFGWGQNQSVPKYVKKTIKYLVSYMIDEV